MNIDQTELKQEVPLQKEFDKNGWHFKMLKRDGDIAMFRKTLKGGTAENIEVVIVQHAKANQWPDGRTTPPRETMPSDEFWGRLGWTFLPDDTGGAQKRFESLCRNAVS